jgi:hypothetical protein
MKAHLKYLRYVLKHKWYVFVGCWALGVPLWQAIIHDWSKFTPGEWLAYVAQFYGHKPDEREERLTMSMGIVIKSREDIKAAFDAAWNHHQKVNPHHWQYWLLITDNDEPRLRPLPIPQRFVLEMVADWYGACMAITGKPEMEAWFFANKDKMILEDSTYFRVTQAIQKAKRKGLIP